MPDNKTVVFTGAIRGIGLELARYYAGEIDPLPRAGNRISIGVLLND